VVNDFEKSRLLSDAVVVRLADCCGSISGEPLRMYGTDTLCALVAARRGAQAIN
jgi:hypothetical protein